MKTLNETDPIAEQPKELSVALRRHQLTMLHAMLKSEDECEIKVKGSTGSLCHEDNKAVFSYRTNVSILADSVGAGKTFTVLSLICSQRVPPLREINVSVYGNYSALITPTVPPRRTNLIVVPHNLVDQWSQFAKKTSLKVLTLRERAHMDCFFDIYYTTRFVRENGKITEVCKTKSENDHARDYFIDQKIEYKDAAVFYKISSIKKKVIERILNDYDAIILNVKVYDMFRNLSWGIKWARVIVDEIASIRLPASFSEYAGYYWFITATPSSMNRMCAFIHRMIVDTEGIVIKNHDSYVESMVNVIPPKVFTITTRMSAANGLLIDLVSKKVVEMICAGDIDGAVRELNCGVDTKDGVIKTFCAKLERGKAGALERIRVLEGFTAVDKVDRTDKIDLQKDRVKHFDDKISLIKERLDSIKTEICFICADSFKNPAIMQCCNNIFCLACLIEALSAGNKTCPYCQQMGKYHLITETAPEKKKETAMEIVLPFEDMEKDEAFGIVLKEIEKNVKNPKILIFSKHVNTCEGIYDKLGLSLKKRVLKGTPNAIAKMVDAFNNGDLNVLMYDSVHYGSGLNLQTADYVIVYHRMEIGVETQAIGRTQRFGRTTQLKIIYLVNECEKNRNKSAYNVTNNHIKSPVDIGVITN